MTALAAFRISSLLHSMIILAAVTLPGFSFAQEVSDTPPSDKRQQYLLAIEAIEDERGANDAALIEPLMALSQFYFEQGAHELAAEGIAQARGIVRINHGISTIQEVELLALEVRAQEAAGNLGIAWELEQSMLVMLTQHTGNIKTYPIYHELSRKRLGILKQYFAGHFPPQIVLGCYYGKSRDRDAIVMGDTVLFVTTEGKKRCGSGDRDTVLITLVREARTYQALAIEALLQNGRYTSAELQELVTSFLRSSETLRRLMPQYGDILLALVMKRITTYEANDDTSMQTQAMFIVQLADLNVRRGYGASRPAGFEDVLAQYRQAYTQLQNAGLAQTELDAIFSPAIPIMLPSFDKNKLTSQEGITPNGYIDVAFNVTRYGRSKELEIIAAADNVKWGQKRELTRLIKENTFRPRITDGQFTDRTSSQFRYYLPSEDQD